MALIVQKFGGTSVGTVERIEAVAEKVLGFRRAGHDMVVVVSAMSGETNRLIGLATQIQVIRLADGAILYDLAAALAGSLGIAPTGNIDPERRYPSMFEPIHGSAFDIMGKGLANPIGTFWSCVMMLEHLGEQAAADALMAIIENVTADPKLHTGDLGGTARTVDVTNAVLTHIASANAKAGKARQAA